MVSGLTRNKYTAARLPGGGSFFLLYKQIKAQSPDEVDTSRLDFIKTLGALTIQAVFMIL